MCPTISVIMAVYNSEAFLAEAVASLQRQTVCDWELIAVDDGSQDGSAALIQKMAAADPRIRLLRMPQNSGAGAADYAIQQARGAFIAILDADDVCEPERLEKRLYIDGPPGLYRRGDSNCADRRRRETDRNKNVSDRSRRALQNDVHRNPHPTPNADGRTSPGFRRASTGLKASPLRRFPALFQTGVLRKNRQLA